MKKLTAFIATFLLPLSLQAASIVIQAGATPAVLKDSKGVLLSTASVKFGFFKTITSTSTTQTLSDLRTTLTGDTEADRTRIADFLASNFVPLGAGGNLGTDNFALTDVVGGGKTVTGSITDINFVTANATNIAGTVNANGLVSNTKIFAVISNNSNIAQSTELGIVSASWNSPQATAPTMNLVFGSVDTAGEVYRGSIGSISLAAFNPVPEPATFSVLALGAMVALRRKRR